MGELRISISRGLKSDAKNTFNKLGMNLPTAIKLFLKQSVQDRALPFKPNINYDARKRRENIVNKRALQIISQIKKYINEINYRAPLTDISYKELQLSTHINNLYKSLPFQYYNTVAHCIKDIGFGESSTITNMRPTISPIAVKLCYEFFSTIDDSIRTNNNAWGLLLNFSNKNINYSSKNKHKFRTDMIYNYRGTDKNGKKRYVALNGTIYKRQLIQLMDNIKK